MYGPGNLTGVAHLTLSGKNVAGVKSVRFGLAGAGYLAAPPSPTATNGAQKVGWLSRDLTCMSTIGKICPGRRQIIFCNRNSLN